MNYSNTKSIQQYKTYNNYLESFLTENDLKYLGNAMHTEDIIKLAHRGFDKVLTYSEFTYEQRKYRLLSTKSKYNAKLFSSGIDIHDPFLAALAEREHSNRMKILLTIIFIHHTTKLGTQISSYIDYADSLTKKVDEATNWYNIFRGKQLLVPNRSHMIYYDWASKYVLHNNTTNFAIRANPKWGLGFKSALDRKLVVADPDFAEKYHTQRYVFQTDLYTHAVLYDHIVESTSEMIY